MKRTCLFFLFLDDKLVECLHYKVKANITMIEGLQYSRQLHIPHGWGTVVLQSMYAFFWNLIKVFDEMSHYMYQVEHFSTLSQRNPIEVDTFLREMIQSRHLLGDLSIVLQRNVYSLMVESSVLQKNICFFD